MVTTHLSRDGEWRVCKAKQRTCPLPLHLAGVTPAVAAQMPAVAIEPLLEAMLPATRASKGNRSWSAGLQPGADGKTHSILHRDFDLPAVIEADGTRSWYRKGKRHRDGGKPAVVRLNGSREWWVNGQRHRDGDLPAEDGLADGRNYQSWYQHGELHRDNDQPAEIDVEGSLSWYQHGTAHRIHGPAVIYMKDGKPYFNEYWLNGELLSEQEWKESMKRMDEAFGVR